jgi:hypothetical protein
MSNDFRFENYEGSIHLAAVHRRGLFGHQLLLRGRRTVRNGGSLPSVASVHSLLSVGLMHALNDINRTNIDYLIRTASTAISKPRIRVTAMDPTFCDALQERMRGLRNEDKPLRAGKQFLSELARQLVRFDISFQTDTENTTGYSLKNWLTRALPAPSLLATIPPSLMPTVTSAVL